MLLCLIAELNVLHNLNDHTLRYPGNWYCILYKYSYYSQFDQSICQLQIHNIPDSLARLKPGSQYDAGTSVALQSIEVTLG